MYLNRRVFVMLCVYLEVISGVNKSRNALKALYSSKIDILLSKKGLLN